MCSTAGLMRCMPAHTHTHTHLRHRRHRHVVHSRVGALPACTHINTKDTGASDILDVHAARLRLDVLLPYLYVAYKASGLHAAPAGLHASPRLTRRPPGLHAYPPICCGAHTWPPT